MEPPSKRQKVNSTRNLNASTISSSSTTSSPLVDSYQPQAQNEDVAMAENNINVDVTMEVKSEAEREQDAGILCFVNAENPGFRGILKQRYVCLLLLLYSSFSVLCFFFWMRKKLFFTDRALLDSMANARAQQIH